MTRDELRIYYEQKKSSCSATLSSTNQAINRVSNLRLTAAIVFILLVYFGYTHSGLLWGLPLALAGFILLVRRHSNLFEKKVHYRNLTDIQRNELHVLNGDFSRNSNGSEFIDVHHPYTHDLDIFGEGSLFQYLNRTHTREGKALLAAHLSEKPTTTGMIKQWQEAISSLAGKPDFRHELQASTMQIDGGSSDRAQLAHWLSEPAFLYGKSVYRVILNTFPPITVLLVILAFFVDGLTPSAILAAAFQWVFLGFHLKRVNRFHQYISDKKNTLEKYAQALDCIRREPQAAAVMQNVRDRATAGYENVRKLAALVRAFDARANSMTNLVVNSLLLYDLQCVYRLEEWKEEHASQLMGWLDAIPEVEVLCSLGTFAFNNAGFAFPTIQDDPVLEAIGLGHPLLAETERVRNDVALGRNTSIMIITGANMAGKSTFLRTLGVNTVLALAGAPVCATSYTCPFLEVRSGMRTADSLRENQSYFYAELDRLKSIMDELRSGQPLLILLDEILKGTNSTDKQAGSVALIKQLVDHSCLVIIATHDLALGELEAEFPGKIANYSFEALIENDQLHFDYKLKRGVAQKMNATFLMKKMGIIRDS